jgi:hypothetical protein
MTKTTEIEDVVIEADLFDLARSQRYKDIDSFREAANDRWKEVGAERVDKCIGLLTERLKKSDYWNFHTEYLQQRPRKRKVAPAATSQHEPG